MIHQQCTTCSGAVVDGSPVVYYLQWRYVVDGSPVVYYLQWSCCRWFTSSLLPVVELQQMYVVDGSLVVLLYYLQWSWFTSIYYLQWSCNRWFTSGVGLQWSYLQQRVHQQFTTCSGAIQYIVHQQFTTWSGAIQYIVHQQFTTCSGAIYLVYIVYCSPVVYYLQSGAYWSPVVDGSPTDNIASVVFV